MIPKLLRARWQLQQNAATSSATRTEGSGEKPERPTKPKKKRNVQSRSQRSTGRHQRGAGLDNCSPGRSHMGKHHPTSHDAPNTIVPPDPIPRVAAHRQSIPHKSFTKTYSYKKKKEKKKPTLSSTTLQTSHYPLTLQHKFGDSHDSPTLQHQTADSRPTHSPLRFSDVPDPNCVSYQGILAVSVQWEKLSRRRHRNSLMSNFPRHCKVSVAAIPKGEGLGTRLVGAYTPYVVRIQNDIRVLARLSCFLSVFRA